MLAADPPSPPLLLASASAARAAMLRAAGLDIEIAPARIDEAAIKASLVQEGAPVADIADRLAEMKAMRVGARRPEALTIGADQILVVDGRIIDKPATIAEARAQLLALRGRSHELLSAAVVVADGAPVWRRIGRCRLTMRAFSDRFLDAYLAAEAEAALRSVGAYRIEGLGAQLFSRIDGDYFTVLGLPLLQLLDYLRTRGAAPT